MSQIIHRIHDDVVKRTAARCKARGITIPTFQQLRNPDKIPAAVKSKLPNVGLWDVNPLNLWRITWKNDTKTGLFGNVNFFEIPKAVTGVDARIIGLTGKFFPTGAHKVGAAFGCLVPRLVSGEFDPEKHKAVWPSTGNYCRGGAFDCALLGCTAVAILPEEMSQERFTWLKEIGAEVIATPGCESNVKEIYDKCWELRREFGDKVVILNQFDEMGNSMWHFAVTGQAMQEVFEKEKKAGQRLAGVSLTQGSAGTLGSGEYLKEVYPLVKLTVGEALQCPTLYLNGFGGHRIEGIGDKHVPWVHNLKHTDVVAAIDDNACIALMRLFNEPAGRAFLKKIGAPREVVDQLALLGISGIAHLIGASYASLGGVVASIAVMAVSGLGFMGLSIALASKIDSTEGFQVLMSFMTMPLVLLSGAFFPISDLPAWLAGLVHLNPLTYAVEAIRYLLLGSSSIPIRLCLEVTAAFAAVMLWMGGRMFGKIRV